MPTSNLHVVYEPPEQPWARWIHKQLVVTGWTPELVQSSEPIRVKRPSNAIQTSVRPLWDFLLRLVRIELPPGPVPAVLRLKQVFDDLPLYIVVEGSAFFTFGEPPVLRLAGLDEQAARKALLESVQQHFGLPWRIADSVELFSPATLRLIAQKQKVPFPGAKDQETGLDLPPTGLKTEAQPKTKDSETRTDVPAGATGKPDLRINPSRQKSSPQPKAADSPGIVPKPSIRSRVFISYSHEDERWLGHAAR